MIQIIQRIYCTFILLILYIGRFDLKSTKFRCKNCKIETKSSIINYITSGFWPGDPQNMSYLISADLLRFWYLTKHNMPGTSMNKFIETLETLFDGQKPVKCLKHFSYKFRINPILFICSPGLLIKHIFKMPAVTTKISCIK